MDTLTTILTEEGDFAVRMDRQGTFFLTAMTPNDRFPDGEIELFARPRPWPPSVGGNVGFSWVGQLFGILPIPALSLVSVGRVRSYEMVEPIRREGASGPPQSD